MSSEPKEPTDKAAKADPKAEAKGSSKGGYLFWVAVVALLFGAAAVPRTRVYGYQWVMVVGSYDMRSWAFDKVAAMDPEIATPALIVALGDKELGIQDRALEKLKNLDKTITLGPVTGALESDDWLTRSYACDILADLAADLGEESVKALIKACKDPQEAVRLSALRALCTVPKFTELRLTVFREAAEDEAFEARGTAMTGLSALVDKADQVRPILVEHLTDPHNMVREYAMSGVVNLDGATKKPFPLDVVLDGAQDKNMDVRLTAIRYLGEAGKSTPEVVAALQKQLDSDSEQLRLLSMIILGNYGREDAAIRAQVLNMTVTDASKLVRLQGILNLTTLGNDKPDVMAAVDKALQDKDGDIRAQAASLVGKREKVEDADVRRLLEMLKKDDAAMAREAALRSLFKVAPEDKLEEACAIAAKDGSGALRELVDELKKKKD